MRSFLSRGLPTLVPKPSVSASISTVAHSDLSNLLGTRGGFDDVAAAVGQNRSEERMSQVQQADPTRSGDFAEIKLDPDEILGDDMDHVSGNSSSMGMANNVASGSCLGEPGEMSSSSLSLGEDAFGGIGVEESPEEDEEVDERLGRQQPVGTASTSGATGTGTGTGTGNASQARAFPASVFIVSPFSKLLRFSHSSILANLGPKGPLVSPPKKPDRHNVQADKGVVRSPGNDPVRYPHPPFDFQRLGPPSRIFGLWHPPLKDSTFFFREAKIDEILMKIAEIEVLFTISISTFYPYTPPPTDHA
ncbi:MAG: hypothetical protein GY835_03080 [bacterium]|nr:hypothetical protein [bacterium]